MYLEKLSSYSHRWIRARIEIFQLEILLSATNRQIVKYFSIDLITVVPAEMILESFFQIRVEVPEGKIC